MIDKMIASIQIRDDDDNCTGHIEIVDTGDKYGDTPVRVRRFERDSATGYYQTWHFEGRPDALSFATTLAGFGPLVSEVIDANDKDKLTDEQRSKRMAWIEALMSGKWANMPVPKDGQTFSSYAYNALDAVIGS